METTCITQRGGGREGHEPNDIHSPIPAAPCSAHLSPAPRGWGRPESGGERSISAGCGTRCLCPSVMVTWLWGCLGAWGKRPAAPGHKHWP